MDSAPENLANYITEGVKSAQEAFSAAARATSSLITGHDEHHQSEVLPPDSTATEVKPIDEEGKAVFEDEGVKHEILKKMRVLAKLDEKHGLGELAALKIDLDQSKGIQFYRPLKYYRVHKPAGIDYIGEIEVEEGKCIHARVFRPEVGKGPFHFHSIDTRLGKEGGAVFAVGDKLAYFDY